MSNHVDFYDENGVIVDISRHETTEQWIADTFIAADAIVLELGGRLGVVSVSINKKLNNTRNHCVIEPDGGGLIFQQMCINLKNHGCDPHVYNGVISKTNQYFIPGGLSSRTRDTSCSCDSYIVPGKTLEQLMQDTNLKFDTLVADCEGCLEKFVDENIDYIDNFKCITFEEDFIDECNYEKIKNILKEHKFKCIRPGGHSVWIK